MRPAELCHAAGFPAVPEELDLVDSGDQNTHNINIETLDLQAQTELDIFKEDPDFEENQQKWQVRPAACCLPE